MAATVLFFAAAINILLDLRRRTATYTELEALLPDACRVPGLRQEIQRLETEEDALKGALAEARVTILTQAECKEWLRLNEANVSAKRQELSQTEARLKALQVEMQSIRDERQAFQEEKTALQAECRDLQQLQRSMGTLRVAVAQKEEAESWLKQYGSLYEEAKQRFPVIQSELDELKNELSDAMLDKEQTQSECRESRHQREWLIREENFLTTAVDQKRREFEDLKSTIEGFESRQAGLQANLEELQTRLEFREQEVRETQAECELAKESLDKFRKEYDQVSAELNVKREEIVHLKSAYSTTNKLLEAAVKRWSEIAPSTAGSDEDRLAELWKPALAKAQFTKENNKDEQENLESTESYLSSLGLQFHPRVLRAFHTSVKVAEMSPLTVLAGISGTGKSELPRRYAEGMGMHFLNLAVQPRWDSPQDMFGFYNYLENRYRATELSRALVQMDQFFDEKGRGWNYPKDWEKENLSNRMLLVLLDEMNLARVEYYFSEFLSRMEIRRGIDKRNPLKRRMAEIGLEVGLRTLTRAKGEVTIDSQPTLQVFVDSNVLFVGTMNEDETTQSLSDKVVDRANVLRFGRPAKFTTAESKEVVPSEKWLSFERWQSWVKDDETLSGQVRDEVTSWVEELNAAMQLIGRPFAHRTFLSVLAYVANYPELEGSSHKTAMADQIELKILPKLRGLDPTESNTRQTISRLQSVLDKVGDQALVSAFSNCIRQSEHQFVWHGVDRLSNE
jgi:hypothetical protein